MVVLNLILIDAYICYIVIRLRAFSVFYVTSLMQTQKCVTLTQYSYIDVIQCLNRNFTSTIQCTCSHLNQNDITDMEYIHGICTGYLTINIPSIHI